MKLIFSFSILALFFTVTACSNTAESDQNNDNTEQVDLKASLQGTWQTTQINVAINSADGLDTFRAEYLTQEIWEKDFKMQPPIFYFQPDQQYKTVHKRLNGEILNESHGTWNTVNDTLILTEADITYQYVVKSGDGRAAFRTFLDWDGDGETDDEYQSVLRQISIGIE